MRRRSLVAVLGLILSLSAGRAEAVTVRDVIELSKAGLSESVLLALIDVDRSVFSIDTATLKQLKSAGVSDAVIVAMIRSGRDTRAEEQPAPVPQEPAPAPEPEPQEAAQPAPAPEPVPYPVAVPVPVYVAIPIAPAHFSERHPGVRNIDRPAVAPNCQSAQLPEWGFGGTIPRLPPPCR